MFTLARFPRTDWQKPFSWDDMADVLTTTAEVIIGDLWRQIHDEFCSDCRLPINIPSQDYTHPDVHAWPSYESGVTSHERSEIFFRLLVFVREIDWEQPCFFPHIIRLNGRKNRYKWKKRMNRTTPSFLVSLRRPTSGTAKNWEGRDCLQSMFMRISVYWSSPCPNFCQWTHSSRPLVLAG